MVKRTSRAKPAEARDKKIIAACHDLMPLLKAAQGLLRRRRLPPGQLVGAVPGLAEWPDAHQSTIQALDIATMITVPGAEATETTFTVVAKIHGVTPEKAKRLYRTWQGKLTRARVLELH